MHGLQIRTSWRNGSEQQVSPLEVYANTNLTDNMFSNFVAPNSNSLPANTDIFSIKAKDGGYEFCTVDPIPYPIYSNSSSEVNLHFVYGGNGKSLGGGVDNLIGIPKHDALTYGLFGTSVWVNTINAGFDAARKVQPKVSTWLKGSRIFAKSSNYLLFATVGYDFATGTANTSTIVNGVVGGIGYGVIVVVGVAATPWVVGIGIAYGVWSVAVGDNWMNNEWDNRHINFVKPRN